MTSQAKEVMTIRVRDQARTQEEIDYLARTLMVLETA